MWLKYLSLGAGGFVGAIARYWISGWAQRAANVFPLGTLVVNVLGSFILGLLATLFLERMTVALELRLFILVGILGSFTTYSTFSLETMHLIRHGEWCLVLLSVGANLLGGLAAVWLGMNLVRGG